MTIVQNFTPIRRRTSETDLGDLALKEKKHPQ